ncbi:MAG: FMN-binding protein [Tindallia sp. MSAO_Bac2]|nr:MAG: FMN-binding protein [Tindallia sp. MSAO_Bac2]
MNKYFKYAIIVVVLIAILYPFGRRGYEMYRYTRAIEQISFQGGDIASVEDGIYEGSYDAILIQAHVTVHVEDGVIKDIEYEHIHERGARGEMVIENVLEEQSLQVDTITGATDSSLVLLKAIEKALFE